MLSRDYIIPALAGRLGNNMFMIAHAYAKGLEYNKQVVVTRSQVVYEGNDYSQNIFRGIEFTDEFVDNNNYNPEIPSDDKHTIYSGYFQSEKYFKKYSETIKSLFGPPLEFVNKIREEIPFIFETEVTVINVRRGDYLSMPNHHPTISKEYICKALELVPCKQYLIASDDILWCKENLDLPNAIYIDEWCPHAQLWIMSLCHHFVISNSSFSWWAAYLSRHTGKKVIAPETWYGPGSSVPRQWQEVYCKDWTVLPTYFKDGIILPKYTNMISVLTLTYKRHHLLEEAIESFLSQKLPPECEMVIINDNVDVDYVYNHPKVRIINHKQRFPSISAKIEWGYKQCRGEYIYRLDDDDLLTPWALRNVQTDIESNPGFNIYRSSGHYFFNNNKFTKECNNVNNGNVYTRAYLDVINFPEKSYGEDADITFYRGGTIYESKLKHTMIYRWGMNTLHISGLGNINTEIILSHADKVLENIIGTIKLKPKFHNDYYTQITDFAEN